MKLKLCTKYLLNKYVDKRCGKVIVGGGGGGHSRE
jgi:hypothetical protein